MLLTPPGARLLAVCIPLVMVGCQNIKLSIPVYVAGRNVGDDINIESMGFVVISSPKHEESQCQQDEQQ